MLVHHLWYPPVIVHVAGIYPLIWCPSSLAKVVYSSNNLVYGRYNYFMGVTNLQTNKTSLASLGRHHLVCIVFFLDPNQYEWEIFLTNGCFHDGYMYHSHWILDQWAMIIHLTGINGHHGSFTPSFDHGIFTSKCLRRWWIFVKRPLKKKTFQKDLLFLTTWCPFPMKKYTYKLYNHIVPICIWDMSIYNSLLRLDEIRNPLTDRDAHANLFVHSEKGWFVR